MKWDILTLVSAVYIKREELEKYRSLREAGGFIDRVFSRVEKHDGPKGYYKYFSEEYIPIYRYLKHVYGLSSNIMFKHVGIENQPYDGVVKIGDLYKRIEIAYLYLSKYANDQQNKIEKEVTHSIRDADELFMQIEKVIMDTARKKAIKPYGDTLLVLYYASGEDLYPGDMGMDEIKFDELIKKLRDIRFHAKRVDFFIPEMLYENSSEQHMKPKRLYRIK